MGEYSFMNEGSLTKLVVDLFQPKSNGTTLKLQGIAKALGIEKAKRSRRAFLAEITGFTLKDLKLAVSVLSNMRNVLYKRTGPYATEAYALNPKHLWRTDEKYHELLRTYRTER